MLVPTSYEGLDDDDEVKIDSEINQNNSNYYYYCVVNDSKSDGKAKRNLFDKYIHDEVEAAPKTTVNTKVTIQ